MPTMTYSETLVVTHCHCGIAVAIPETLYSRMKESASKHAYCPLGHQFIFSNTLEKELEAEQAEVARLKRQVTATRDLLKAEEHSHRATRGHVTRLKQRASAGVCPCCNRQFQNVARHMATKHPDFAS